ncbi:MAG: glycosyltransferase family 9 protein [Gammaproteobacteria bacterium]
MSLSFEQPPQSICLIRLSAIGDCCHTVPVVRTIQQVWPGTRITWIIGRTEFSLLEGLEGVEFVALDKGRGIAGLPDIRRRLRGRKFPLLLHMHASMRANLVSRTVDADLRIGFDRSRARDSQWLFTNQRIDARQKQHVMDGLFGFAEYLGIDQRVVRWDIPLANADRQLAENVAGRAQRICVISPCTSQRFRNYRNWRPENFAAVAEYATRHFDAKVILTGSDTAIENEFAREIGRRAAVENLVGRTSLKQLLAILGRADLLICPDSGPAHMATAVGTPVIGLYATSNTWRTGPYYSQPLVVDRYPEAVDREFGKPVDELRWGQRVRDPAAMDLITVDDVTAKIDLVLGSDKVAVRHR